MTTIPCIFCGTEDGQVVIEENGFQGRQCAQCGLIYISPRPSLDEIIDLYGHDDAHISAESHIAAEFSKRLFARHHLRIIRALVTHGELLEVGAGAGYFLDEAKKAGFSPHGLEFNPTQASYIRDQLHIPCEEAPLSTTIFSGKKFDVIYHCDVISHLFDPIADFKTLHTIMNEGALLVFETGNLGEVDRAYFRYFQRFQYPDHLFFFSTANLAALLEQTGFDLIKIHRYSIVPQLLAVKMLSGIRNALRGPVHTSDGQLARGAAGASHGATPGAPAATPKSTSQLMGSLMRTYQYVEYMLRYQLGRIAPHAHRPQTVIVVARKRA